MAKICFFFKYTPYISLFWSTSLSSFLREYSVCMTYRRWRCGVGREEALQDEHYICKDTALIFIANNIL